MGLGVFGRPIRLETKALTVGTMLSLSLYNVASPAPPHHRELYWKYNISSTGQNLSANIVGEDGGRGRERREKREEKKKEERRQEEKGGIKRGRGEEREDRERHTCTNESGGGRARGSKHGTETQIKLKLKAASVADVIWFSFRGFLIDGVEADLNQWYVEVSINGSETFK